MGVPPIAVAVMVIIIRVVVIMAVVIKVAVVLAAVAVMAPGKGSGENPEKSSLWKEEKSPSGAPNTRQSTCGGNKYTYRRLTHLKKAIRRKTRGGLPVTRRQRPHTDREKGRPKKK